MERPFWAEGTAGVRAEATRVGLGSGPKRRAVWPGRSGRSAGARGLPKGRVAGQKSREGSRIQKVFKHSEAYICAHLSVG